MFKTLPALRQLIIEAETSNKNLVLDYLPYGRSDLEPVLSEQSIDYHYGKLARGYVDRYNNKEGDLKFNEAGAFLHNIYFPQLTPPKTSNQPFGISSEFIKDHFKEGLEELKNKFTETAMSIQGSGWVYLSRSGKIKTIVNHEIRSDIILLIDWWEHAWSLDYQADKAKYLKNTWRIINWAVINDRLNLKTV